MICICVATIELAACAPSLKEQMTKLVGQPLDAATAKLGTPNDQQVIAGHQVYTWSTLTLSGQATTSCRLRVTMEANVIDSWDADGSGCGRYARMLQFDSSAIIKLRHHRELALKGFGDASVNGNPT
jgi:hypothetical protein